jgi:hypothetical protein
MAYRTKTYIAADWDGDKNAIDQLHAWNDGKKWILSFTDAHDLTQARDNSLNCSIKVSLATRMDASKTFVLIVGSGTKSRRAGECNIVRTTITASAKRAIPLVMTALSNMNAKRLSGMAKTSNSLSCITQQLSTKANALTPSNHMVRTLQCKKW